ncbi:hypothetical protein, partial [Escherichia coli]|uniref:hypothetical protein n=6 Tax=Escherichia coli TaxID=562 RepID=UPI001A902778
VSIKNDGHYFCRAGGNRPDGLNEPVTNILTGCVHSWHEAAGAAELKVRCERTADIHYTWFKHEPELYCLAVSVLRFTRSAVQKIGLKSSH